MNILFTADLHLTDNPRDEYRWNLLPWLAKQARDNEVDLVVLGGDITDAKDKHPSALVNRLVRGLTEIADECEVIILKGNHDYIDEGWPFFDFTTQIKAKNNITFLTMPLDTRSGLLFLPNTKDYEAAWEPFRPWEQYNLIFTHATFDGCLSESGYKLSGIPPSFFKGAKKVWSGDIHKPQQVGRNIEYVGAPYRIRFGDDFKPRVVLLEQEVAGPWHISDLHFKCQGKHLIEITNTSSPREAAKQLQAIAHTGGLEIMKGDQVKIRVALPRVQYPEWPAIKAALIECSKDDEFQLTGPELVAADEPAPKRASSQAQASQDGSSPLEALAVYVEEKAVPTDLQDAGERYLKQAIG